MTITLGAPLVFRFLHMLVAEAAQTQAGAVGLFALFVGAFAVAALGRVNPGRIKRRFVRLLLGTQPARRPYADYRSPAPRGTYVYPYRTPVAWNVPQSSRYLQDPDFTLTLPAVPR